MGRILLIYVQEDRHRAAEIAAALESAGYVVFWDLRPPPGVAFGRFVDETMEDCQCAVVLWSWSSIRDDWVKSQASKARQREILVPALLADVTPQIPLEFSRLTATDLTAWRPGLPTRDWALFLGAISDRLGAPESRVAPADDLKAARRSLQLPAAAFAVALAAEYLVSVYFLEPERTGVIALGALWAAVAALGVRAAVKARRRFPKSAALLGWLLAPLGLVIYVYALASFGAVAHVLRYHAALFVLVVAVTIYATRKTS